MKKNVEICDKCGAEKDNPESHECIRRLNVNVSRGTLCYCTFNSDKEICPDCMRIISNEIEGVIKKHLGEC